MASGPYEAHPQTQCTANHKLTGIVNTVLVLVVEKMSILGDEQQIIYVASQLT
jgi:hypothetical protein